MTSLLVMVTLASGTARGEVPLPSFRDALARSAWFEVNDQIEASKRSTTTEEARAMLVDAIRDATAFQEHVTRSSGLEHLTCEAWRRLGDDAQAEAACRRAIDLEPEYSGPWYDLGEMMLAAQRLEEAERAFTQVERLETSGPQAVLGPYRLAEVAGVRRDPAAFEDHLREALKHGFSFRDVACLPRWQSFYADPVMRDSLDKLLTVYGDDHSTRRLSGATPCF